MKDLLKKEVIGLTITIIKSKNQSDIGIQGKIIDETKHTLLIETKERKTKRLFKSNITFTVNIEDKKFQVDGKALSGKPFERIKTRL